MLYKAIYSFIDTKGTNDKITLYCKSKQECYEQLCYLFITTHIKQWTNFVQQNGISSFPNLEIFKEILYFYMDFIYLYEKNNFVKLTYYYI